MCNVFRSATSEINDAYEGYADEDDETLIETNNRRNCAILRRYLINNNNVNIARDSFILESKNR